MRILHVVATAQRRGAEVFAADLVSALGQDSVTQRVGILRQNHGLKVTFDAPLKILEDGGWRLPAMRMHAKTVRHLRRLVKEWSPNVVQAHGGEALKYSVLACVGSPAKVVYRKIGPAQGSITRGPRRLVYTALIARAAAVVAVGDELKRETIDLFKVPEERVVAIPNGVDSQRLTPTLSRTAVREELGVPLDAPLVMSLGALMWAKEPLDLVAVADRVMKKRPDALYVVVGDGPLRADMEAEIARLGIEDRVLMLGIRSDVQNLLGATDVLLLTGGSEGMPGSVIEAGMAGVPVAGFRAPGVQQIVADGETGLLAEPGDLDDLGACVVRLLDEKVRVPMGLAARERCESEFGIESIASRYMEVYENVLRRT